MADMDVFAAMGIAGFGKATKKRTLDPSRFDKSKREDVTTLPAPAPALTEAGPSNSAKISADDESEDDSDNPGPPPPPKQTLPIKEDEDADMGSDDEEPEFDPDAPDFRDSSDPQFPITHEATLKEHTKVISALALDPSGARVLSGSHDYDVKLWDFGGMTTQTRSFKTWEPAGSYYVNDLKYSNNGQQFLVISGTSQAKLFDREGEEKATFIKGDMYIRDMKHTSGHVSDLSGCAWHPKEAQYFITSSADSTIRIWDVEDKRKQKTVIVVKSKERGARTKVTTCAYSPDGRLISGACLDGALHMWQASSNFVRPNMTVEGAHDKGTETGSVVFSVDGRTVLTRGGAGDDTVKLWDLRAFKKPLATRSGLTTLYPATNAVFSPDEKYILTGAGASAKGGRGKLTFLTRDGLEAAKEVEMETTPVKVLWHSKINQIVTGLANGSVSVLYSPVTSLNGAKLLLAKGAPKKRTIEDMSDALAAPSILTPHALPMFRDGEGIVGGTKRRREKERNDPRKSRRPELPVTGPGRGGRVGASATQHVVQNLVRDTTRDEDPREALLKYAKLAEDDPQWTGDVIPANMDEFTENEHESDARHESTVTKLDPAELAVRSVSTCAEISTPLDPASIPVAAPSGTPPPAQGELLEDVKMAEEVVEETIITNGVPATNGVNGVHNTNGDVDMEQLSTHTNGRAHSHDTPAADTAPPESPMAALDSTAPSTSYTTPNDLSSPRDHPNPEADEEDVKPPPAKRARKFSDADQASIANTASPPPVTASSVQTNGDTVMGSTPAPQASSPAGPSTLSVAQHRFCLSTIRQLKKLKDAVAFLHPVDPIAFNIPHYPSIIKNPMDLGTIERKLLSSNPAKPDPNPNNPRYFSADEFISDVRLVFSNAVTFNGPEHVVSVSGKHVESVFDKQIKQLPAPAEVKPPVVKKPATPPPPPPPLKKASSVRRASTSVPVIRRNEVEQATARPKREIHPPPPKDLPYADVPKKMRKVKTVKNDGTAEQLKYCAKILSDLHRKQHWGIANAFYEPVDPVKLDIPTYHKVIKKPMDMSTMRKKLENHEYPNASKFFDDFKLMIRNCFTFNPPGTPVNQAGIELQRLFDEKWKSLPQLHDGSDEEEEEEEYDESDDERARRIATMEAQIESMRNNILNLKTKPPPKEKKKKEKKEKAATASTSKASSSRANKTFAAGNGSTKRKGKKQMLEDDVLSFEQKKDLSEAITKLDGTKLEKVIQIIHEGVPEIRDSTEEIELEIDLLPVHVLTKLYNFVLRPLRQPPVKRNRTGKGTGTGGLKRKSMDEDVEAEKIRQLEERMRLFDQSGSGGSLPAVPAAAGRHGHDSEHSSDSSSGSDSSGSESE
ncbi:hypothetical protein BV22DRAFT_1114517 [Leucogyrophana mollusca]|uniref:Uncharacterized protein n=1 Tax=Leucogyrophana mollusca TaxID=85980 RepID=A0ACB8B8Z9_9AGAM|nr:hypothetical protein BV22DRAFT_1114517 [Leucogyrophana mollusca]